MASEGRILFSVLPPRLVHSLNTRYVGVGHHLATTLPSLREDLLQAQIDLPVREYAGNAFFASLGNAAFIALLTALVGSLAKAEYLAPTLVAALLVFGASFLTLLAYPKIVARKRARRLETHVIPATRQLLIQLKSGVPLFNGIASLATDYGELSAEFKKIVNRINAGVSEIEALTEAARENPGLRFRRVLWQISNALKVGGDVSTALEAMLEELTREKLDELKRYGGELSPWIMMYMLASVILPSLGVSLVIVILSFLAIDVPKSLLAYLFAGLVGFNLFFLNFVSTRRPVV